MSEAPALPTELQLLFSNSLQKSVTVMITLEDTLVAMQKGWDDRHLLK